MSLTVSEIMPLWVSIYFSVYLAFSLWAHISDFRTDQFEIWSVFEVVGNMCLLLPALAYWYPALRSTIADAVGIFFVFGVASLIIFIYRGFKKHFPDPDLSLSANIGLSILSNVLVIFVTSPLIWWGGQAVMSWFALSHFRY
jgi:hypothetical protein